MKSDELLKHAIEGVSNAKGLNLSVIDVRAMTDMTDYMVIVTGTSNRHVKAILRSVVDELRLRKRRPAGIEGEKYGNWILLDFIDVVVHIMDEDAREFYALERLWQETLNMPTTA